ncbi:Mgm101p-domain-containing protein [Polyplosphaeria fusca]|uniref:Mitochondrial genome maintenance protein MGM101 n=1 Tax=Polyplosphaeria fusca TaxID=682080 RepID=A0A9P4R0Z2_9PLEO|nr:Mgm101p-domain-containing protein [Polyplosphaeria fusca]
MTMALTPASRAFCQLLIKAPSRSAPAAYRIHSSRRAFTSSPIPAAFASSTPRAATPTATSTGPKPAATSAAKPAAKPAVASTAQRTVTPQFPSPDPPLPTSRSTAHDAATRTQHSLTNGLSDSPPEVEGVPAIDWTRSFHGLGGAAFTAEQRQILLDPLVQDDVEVKPDGLLYLPEIKYRRILNRAFGPGGWGLAPRGETIVTGKLVTREYGLVVLGRLVSIARGEQQYFDPDGIPTATEGCKSNALMRCCKDLGIASELWDPRFIREFTGKMTKEVWVEHVTTKKKRKVVLRKDDTVKYPFKESKA